MTLRIDELRRKTRNHPVLRSLVAMESELALPIPSRRGEKIYLRYLVHDRSKQRTDPGRINIHRPYARVSIAYDSGELVEFMQLGFAEGRRLGPFGEVIGHYPHPAMAGLDYQAATARRTDLDQRTEQVIPLYGRTELSPTEILAVRAYRALFEQVSEPCLRPAYQELSPDFYAWLAKVTG